MSSLSSLQCFKQNVQLKYINQVLPNAKYLTLLRDPVDSFESNYVYMGLEKAFNMDINQFAEKRTGPKVRNGYK